MKTKTKPKTIPEIKQAIKDSKAYFKKKFPHMKPNAVVISVDDWKKGMECLAVANEICTLNWTLGKGKLNCYNKKLKEE